MLLHVVSAQEIIAEVMGLDPEERPKGDTRALALMIVLQLPQFLNLKTKRLLLPVVVIMLSVEFS